LATRIVAECASVVHVVGGFFFQAEDGIRDRDG